jgi:hypothetical protein
MIENRMIGLATKDQHRFRHPEPDLIEVLDDPRQSRRQQLRLRRADSRVTGRKSRRNADRKRFRDAMLSDTVLGMARVYFNGTGTPAMQENVRRAVFKLAADRAKETGQVDTKALKEVEGRMLQLLVDHDGRADDAS